MKNLHRTDKPWRTGYSGIELQVYQPSNKKPEITAKLLAAIERKRRYTAWKENRELKEEVGLPRPIGISMLIARSLVSGEWF
jgi:hypothetical protein